MCGCSTSFGRGSSGQPGVTAVFVVISQVIIQLPFEVALVPEKRPIEVLAPHRPYQSLNERMGSRGAGNGVYSHQLQVYEGSHAIDESETVGRYGSAFQSATTKRS
jgi:hypothetical protein